jgi:putative Holliday junction resolvase
VSALTESPAGAGAGTLGLDYGERRVGIAAADPTGTIASPLGSLERRHPAFWTELGRTCRERGCHRVVVGLPLRLDGTSGEAAERARSFAAQVERRIGVAVVLWDERLTTRQAERDLISAGARRAVRRRRIDAAAAALMLQGFLDAHAAAARAASR